MNEKAIVVIGNPFDGMRVVGPFDGIVAAQEWADDCVTGETWVVVTLEQP